MTRDVLLVDWFGRGGIAHCSEAWIDTLRGAGCQVDLATRAGRELASSVQPAVSARSDVGGAIGAHVALIAKCARRIRRHRPDVLLLQGFVVPQLELELVAIAQHLGTEVVIVAHEYEVPPRVPGGSWALSRLLRRADRVVVHSRFVEERIRVLRRRDDSMYLPVPIPVGLLAARGKSGSVVSGVDGPLALHFGHLHRAYKGTSFVADIVRAPLPPWNFAIVGRDAPVEVPGATTISRFLRPGELVDTVAASQATLLPYRRASQSAAVVLAQALGSLVFATDVGAMSEQVEDGVTGVILGSDAPAGAWREQISILTDDARRAEMTRAALLSVTSCHEQFVSGAREVVGDGSQ